MYRCRLLEEFVLCAHFQSLLKEKYSFVSVFKQIISYIYKNFVVILDLIVERMGPSYTCQPNFDKLKVLLSKRKSYFEVSSTFNAEKRLKLLAANFASIENILQSGSQIKHKTCRVSPLLVQVLALINTGKSAADKEEELAKFFDMIEIDYRTLCNTDPIANLKREFSESIFTDKPNKSSLSPAPSKRNTDKSDHKKRDKSEDRKVTFSMDTKQSVQPINQYLLPPISSKFKYTIVLDLDETLIHFVERKKKETQFLLRPYVREFIRTFGRLFELVIFTAAVKEVDPSH